MKTKSRPGRWLGGFTAGAALALSMAGIARALPPQPTEEVTIVVSNPVTGNVVAGGTFDSGQHTGPTGQTPPFSSSSTQITTGFTGGTGFGGVTMTGGQHTADNSYPSTATAFGQYLESILNNVTNTNSSATDVTIVVSATNFVPTTGTIDTLDNLSLSGSYTNANGSSITAKWYEDNGNHQSTVTGTAGSPPVITLAGSQMGSTFAFTATDNALDAFSNAQNNLPVSFTNPFSMTLVSTLHLTPGAVLSNRTQGQLAQVPEPATMGLAVLGGLAFLSFGRRRRIRLG